MMRFAGSLGIFAVTTALLVPTAAFADEAPPPLPAPPAESTPATSATSTTTTIDAVHLRNGGLYRGHVTEIVPGDHVTVAIEKGETKRVPWAEIDRVIVASTAIPAPPSAPVPGAAAPATPPLPAPMVGPRARVHISSSKKTILYRRPAGSNGWVAACTSPCNEELPIGDAYRVTGNGVASSKEFHLDVNPGGTVDVAIDPPSTGGMVLGGFMAGGGATAAYVGLLMAAVGASSGTSTCTYRNDSLTRPCDVSKDDDLRNAGLITMAVGAGLTLAGILVFVGSAKTDITQSSGKGESSGAAKTPRPLDAFLRAPTWKSAPSGAERAISAAPASFPIVLQGTF